MLAGQLSYDDIADREQAAVRAAWRDGIDADLAALDLRARFEAEGRTRWSEADEHGNVTVHDTGANDTGAPASAGAAVTHGRHAR